MMYGLLGSPVGKSWSEVLFNRIFELEENNNIYTAINVSPVTLKRLMEKIDMSFQGFNVTIPYKEDILRYTENRDPLVWKAGVSNVIKREGNGFTAFNTDYAGIEELFTKNGVSLDGKRVFKFMYRGSLTIIVYNSFSEIAQEQILEKFEGVDSLNLLITDGIMIWKV